jgi:hypothetical protein
VFSILAISEIGIPISFIYKSITVKHSLNQVNSVNSYDNRTQERINGQDDTFVLSKRYILRNFTFWKNLKNFCSDLDNPIVRGYIFNMFNRSVD